MNVESKVRVVTVNAGHTDNLGDQAIDLCLERLLNEFGCTVIRSTPRRSRPPIESGLRPKRRLGWLRSYIPRFVRVFVKHIRVVFRHANIKPDIVVIGGGQLLHPPSAFTVFLWVLTARMLRSSVLMFGVGGEGGYRVHERLLLQWAVRMADDVYVRDHISADLVKEQFGVRASHVPDIAFMCSEYFCHYTPQDDVDDGAESEGKIAFLLPASYQSVSKYGFAESRSKYISRWIDEIKAHEKTSHVINLLAMTEKDYGFVNDLNEQYKKRYKVSLSTRKPTSVADLLKTLAVGDLVVSNRMHALILGLCVGCRVITISRNQKLADFKEMYANRRLRLADLRRHIRNALSDALRKAS